MSNCSINSNTTDQACLQVTSWIQMIILLYWSNYTTVITSASTELDTVCKIGRSEQIKSWPFCWEKCGTVIAAAISTSTPSGTIHTTDNWIMISNQILKYNVMQNNYLIYLHSKSQNYDLSTSILELQSNFISCLLPSATLFTLKKIFQIFNKQNYVLDEYQEVRSWGEKRCEDENRFRGREERETDPWPLGSLSAPWEISRIERAGASIWSLNQISLKLQNLVVLK